MIDKLNIGQKFIITYRPNTHNGVARPKLKNGKDTRQITRRAQWNDKSVVKDQDNNIRYITYYDLDQQGYRCAVGKVITYYKTWTSKVIDAQDLWTE